MRDYVLERGFAPQDFSMRMVIHHSAWTHLYTGSPLIPLTDWVEDRQRSREWLDRLVKQLNSAEDLDATSGEFFTELVFVKNRWRGAGANGKEYNPGRMSYETMLKKKRSVVTIKKKDKLCCARAIVTMKAKADQGPQCHNMMHGRRCQEHRAKTLHKDAGYLKVRAV